MITRMNAHLRIALSSALVLGFVLVLPSRCHARQWALLIGVEQYQNVVPLRFTATDVHELAAALRSHGRYEPGSTLEITDGGSSRENQPYAVTLKNRIPEWLRHAGDEDTVLVFFSGHGFRDEAGKMYLAPIDFDRAKAASTGIAVEWLRDEIQKCKAKFKLLVIDSCHAGSEKTAETGENQLPADLLGNEFRSLEGVVTLASCRAEEKSQIWDFKQRSLYSYWLTEGLKGHADRDSDGRVDIDELHKYVSARVTHTATVRFPRSQTPVRIIGPQVTGSPTVVTLDPQPLRKLLTNMADHVAILLSEHRINKVGVLEFTDDSQLRDVLGGSFGLLGKFCGDELERQLVMLGQDAGFRIVDRNQLRDAILNQGGLKLDDLSSRTRLVSLSKDTGGMQVLALGGIRNRQGRIIRLHCEIKELRSGDLLGVTGGTATLSENEWAMLGQSVAVRVEDRTPQVFASTDRPKPVEDRLIDALDQRAKGGHILLDPVFHQNYDVVITVNGKLREPVFRGNDCFIGVKRGDKYTIRLVNNSGQIVIVRTLVDGLDTNLRVPDKGLATDLWAQPVTHLDDARPSFLDPQDPQLNGRKPIWEIQGFTTKTGRNGKVREFEVVNSADSLAGRQGFIDQIGLITVAFYSPAGGRRVAFGTGAGEELDREILERKGPKTGNLIGVVHIRYVDADTLR